MAVHSIIPTSNVLMADVRDTLNANGGNVGNDLASFFTDAANINPFSKKKPVVLTKNFCQDFDSSAVNYDADWWKGTNMDCGLQLKSVVNYASLPEAYDGDMNGWVYRKPTGGSNEPLRLGDFVGYYPDAMPMLFGFVASDLIVSKTQGSEITFMCAMTPSGGNSVTFADMQIGTSTYFGVYIVSGDNSRRLTSANTVGNGGNSVKFDAYELNLGEWTAYPFLSTAKYSSTSDLEIAGSYYTIPKLKPVTFTVVSSTTSINIQCHYNYDDSAVGLKESVTVDSITVKSQASKQFTNNYVMLRFAASQWGDAMLAGEKRVQLADFTTPSNGIYTFTLSAAQSLFTLDKPLEEYRIWVSIGNGLFYNAVEPMSEAQIPL